MSWDSPSTTKLFMGAAAAVLVAGWAAVYSDRPPMLKAPRGSFVQAGGEMRDAVASPAMPMAAGGWLQAAALSRATHLPSVLNPAKQALPPRATTGRAAFSSPRVIVDRVKPGVPEPTVASH